MVIRMFVSYLGLLYCLFPKFRIPALSGKAAPVSQPKVIKLPNGVTVVSQDKNGGVSVYFY